MDLSSFVMKPAMERGPHRMGWSGLLEFGGQRFLTLACAPSGGVAKEGKSQEEAVVIGENGELPTKLG